MKHSIRIGEVAQHVSSSIAARSSFVCYQCRHRTLALAPNALPFVSLSVRGYASATDRPSSITQALKERIWGKSKAKEQEDPYGDQIVRDRDKKRSESVAEPPQVQARAVSSATDDLGDYVPASTWDGLEQIGGLEWAREKRGKREFEGFMAPSQMQSREDISVAIHRALVEIVALKNVGLSMAMSMTFEESTQTPFSRDIVQGVGFKQNVDGTITVGAANENIEEEVLLSLIDLTGDQSITTAQNKLQASAAVLKSHPDVVKGHHAIDEGSTSQVTISAIPADNRGMLEDEESGPVDDNLFQPANTLNTDAPKDEPWLNIRLDNPQFKFALLKRVMQLTGIRIPDPAIEDIKSIKNLLGLLVKKPKPKKLVDSLLIDGALTSLPNVKIMDRRYTPIDKEKEVGRWKVIEKELIKKGLPVTGGQARSWSGNRKEARR